MNQVSNDWNTHVQEILEAEKKEKRLGMHSFHRYYGKLIPAIPKAYINEFTNAGDLVFDPFSGSGTVALEAKRADRNFLGIEINPLSVLMARVKTYDYDVSVLTEISKMLEGLVDGDLMQVREEEIPFCINRDHWFNNSTQMELVKIHRNIIPAVKTAELECGLSKRYEEFFTAVLSAIVKQVSNADTMHVFPGRSKRMRRLEAEGKIHINVRETYFRGVKKRISYAKEMEKFFCDSRITIFNEDSSKVDLSQFQGSVDLIVTNPPYISSVRYAETLKLELYWMGVIKDQKEYLELSQSMIGNDRIQKKDYESLKLTNYDAVNEYIKKMYNVDKKQAQVLCDYFTLMEKVIQNMATVLKSGKRVVLKISDSRIKKIKIPTGKLLTNIAESNGFEFSGMFDDKINNNSRSLLTTRNEYSDIILEDNIIFWERV